MKNTTFIKNNTTSHLIETDLTNSKISNNRANKTLNIAYKSQLERGAIAISSYDNTYS